jgi:hypothetical protein
MNEQTNETNNNSNRKIIKYKSNGKPRKCISLLIKLQASTETVDSLATVDISWCDARGHLPSNEANDGEQQRRAEQREFPVDWLHDEEIKYKNKSLYLHHIYE